MRYDNSDMDDLFKRASEGYPLRTDSADWDRLAGALDGEPAIPSDETEKRRRRGIFLWFLLVPLVGIGYVTWMVSGKHAASIGGVQVEKAGAGVGAAAARAERGVSSGEEVRKMRTRDSGAALGSAQNAAGLQGNEVSGSKKVAISNQKEVSGPQQDVDGLPSADKSTSDGGKVRSLRTRGYDGTKNNGSGVVGSDAVGSGGRNMADGSAGRSATAGLAGKSMTGGSARGSETGGSAQGSETGGSAGSVSPDHELAWAFLDLRPVSIGGGFKVVVEVVAPKVAPDSTPQRPKKHSHGYIGVSGAPDFSTVRFQTMKGVGTTFGVLLGYSFNDHWAVESGLYLDRKRYYTAGEYFDTAKVRMPLYSKLLNVDGTCYMLEIPVNVRYNFNTSSRMRWFATAGLSTYLMSKENYTYQYESGWMTADSNWNIHRPSQYWFSIVSLSAGFEQRLGKIGNLRLEPYVRIPLSGIGTGKLPIVSGGVNIGITHQLW